jgi:hypothetical protein
MCSIITDLTFLLGFAHKTKILFKLLVSTFGLSLDTLDVDKFYLNKIRRKLNCWSITRPSLGRRVPLSIVFF